MPRPLLSARVWPPALVAARGLLRLLLPVAALVILWLSRTALLTSIRSPVLWALFFGTALGIVVERRGPWPKGRLHRVLVVLWALGLAGLVAQEVGFLRTRARVLAAPSADLAAVGEHLVVGYRDLDELRGLVERDAVAGVYVSRRNMIERGYAGVQGDLAELQAIRRGRGRPPLLVAADQEGGIVSHLSPPLTRLPALGAIAADAGIAGPEAAIRGAACVHGRELRALGVTVDFAPVVDLRVDVDRGFDHYSRIQDRAIDRDPALVARVADWYCAGLRAHGVACTLKHFPGLGRVVEDTHFFAGHLREPRDRLEAEDLAPFRALAAEGEATTLIMLSHTLVDAFDPETPASHSDAIVRGLLRDGWGHDGVLITDDLSMFPISLGPGGVGGASERALAAGVDLLLISFDPDLYYEAVDHLLERRATLDAGTLARSVARLRALRAALGGR
ncbi:MAG: glycoside hydrolase family 3 N-terminal domain-containing protein [Nannocystaceae bacterium]